MSTETEFCWNITGVLVSPLPYKEGNKLHPSNGQRKARVGTDGGFL